MFSRSDSARRPLPAAGGRLLRPGSGKVLFEAAFGRTQPAETYAAGRARRQYRPGSDSRSAATVHGQPCSYQPLLQSSFLLYPPSAALSSILRNLRHFDDFRGDKGNDACLLQESGSLVPSPERGRGEGLIKGHPQAHCRPEPGASGQAASAHRSRRNFLIMAAQTRSRPSAAPSPPRFVAASTAKFFAGATQATQ